MRIFFTAIAFIFLFTAQSVYAQNAPVPANKKEEIGDLDKKLVAEKSKQKELQKQMKEIEGKLDDTKGQLVKTAKSVQKNEKELQSLDAQIKEMEAEQSKLQEDLQNDRGSIARLLLALERIRRLPPEALIARPETPLKTAQSAMLMQEIIPALTQQAEQLKADLEKLNTLSTALKDKHDKATSATKALQEEQKELEQLVKKRTNLYASTQDDLKERQQRIKQISTQSKNLQELVKKLEKERAQAAAERTARQASTSKPSRQVGLTPPKAGQPRMPVAGMIKVGYNEPDNFGAPSQGVDIEGRAGALVVAPMGGIIRFAGYFKNYGNMVILEHADGWHSLVAGLEKIDTVVDQSVEAGEPIGNLHQSSTGQNPVLYYELRHKGKAVNPAKKFADLG